MASQSNTFAVLRGYRGAEAETILARVTAQKAAEEERRRTVDKWVTDTQKPFADAANPEHSHGGRGRNERNTGPERHSRRGRGRYGRNTGRGRHNRGGQRNSSNRAFAGLEHNEEGQDVSYNRGVRIGSGRSNVGGDRDDTYYDRPRRDVKVEGKQHEETQVSSDDSDGDVEKLGPVRRDERRDDRIKNRNSGGYRGYQGKYRDSTGFVQKWVPAELKEYGIEGSGSAAYRRGGGEEELEKGVGDADAEYGDVAVGASMEPEPNKEEQHEEPSPEEAERLAEKESEEKRMTLREYEPQFQEKRKALESVKMEERKVTLDKEFESMQIVGKKSKEESTSGVKNNTDRDKKKKAAMDSYDDQAHKRIIIPGFRHYRPRYSGKQSGRYDVGHSSRTRADLDLTPAIQDETEFPALGGGPRNA